MVVRKVQGQVEESLGLMGVLEDRSMDVASRLVLYLVGLRREGDVMDLESMIAGIVLG